MPKHNWLVPAVEWRGQGGAEMGNWRCVVTPEKELVTGPRKEQLSIQRVLRGWKAALLGSLAAEVSMLGGSKRSLCLGCVRRSAEGQSQVSQRWLGCCWCWEQGRTSCQSQASAATAGSAQHLPSPGLGGSPKPTPGTAERGIPSSTWDTPGMLSYLSRGKACLPKEKALLE